jgi:hypothetical protein
MSDVEQNWFNTFNPYGEEFETACPAYDSLDKKTQTVGSLMKLELDMRNGGFIQFFCNWGHSAYILAADGLGQIGAHTAKKLIEEAFSVIDKYEDDERIKALWDIPKALSDEDNVRLERLDEKYWEDEDDVMRKMLSFFSNNE